MHNVKKRKKAFHKWYVLTFIFIYKFQFVFLKIAGMLFPSSDFIHPVMTPVMGFFCHLLGQGKISNRREVNAALFTAYLAYEVNDITVLGQKIT